MEFKYSTKDNQEVEVKYADAKTSEDIYISCIWAKIPNDHWRKVKEFKSIVNFIDKIKHSNLEEIKGYLES